ncbi:8503_t:CDS:2 [Entrophospora sp. SA101]|nr:7722_t:CDS:2 [Entrophospora sp. SA101]CAJ0823378.1 8503_t:CDS:2 [Entrophospora sp. SA101]
MGNCLGTTKPKTPPKPQVFTASQAYPANNYSQPPLHYAQNPHNSLLPLPPNQVPPQPYMQLPPNTQPFPPLQRNLSYMPVQQPPYPQQFPPMQQPYNPQLINPLNTQINDMPLGFNPQNSQIPQILTSDHGLNPVDSSNNVEGVNSTKVLAQYVTKAAQTFEDYGIDDVEKNLQPPSKDEFCLNCQSEKVDVDPDGFAGEYCSNECRKEAVSFADAICIQCKEYPQEAYPCSLWCSINCRDLTPNWQRLIHERSDQYCIYCKKENALAGSDFCSDDCEISIKKMAPCLLKLPSNGQKYKDITNQFTAAWKHPHKMVPEITAIWKIFCSEDLNSRYNVYRDEVENHHKLAGKFFPKGDGKRKMSPGNEQRRFHGTKTTCNIGLTSDGSVCEDPTCAVCSIIKGGYKLRFVGTGTISAAFQRFGRGIYFSGTSSKSDDYNEGSLKYFQGSNYKVMILNKVVVGQGYQLTKDNMKLVEPPPGFNSILGEPSKTGNLNYDEVVVYREEASIPQYLIVYKVK